MKNLPQSWPFPTEVKRVEDDDQRAACVRADTSENSLHSGAEGASKGTVTARSERGVIRVCRPPKPRTDSFDAPF